MNNTLNLLGIFTDIYGVNGDMSIPRALLISLVGFLLVFLVLAIIALFIRFIAKCFSIVGNREKPAIQMEIQPTPVAVNIPQATTMIVDDGIDDKTQAVIMAIVSHESGIPLNKLDFKSIKLMEDK